MGKEVLVIGDVHGMDIWKNFVNQRNYNKIIFLGDYVDSFVVPDKDIIENLEAIIKFKQENPNKVILLLGNHDIQYMYEGNNCSGKRMSYEPAIRNLFHGYEGLFKIMHREGNYLFSHAGLTNDWIDYNKKILQEFSDDLIESINRLYSSHLRTVLFQCGGSRGGWSKYSGPLWADKSETLWELIKIKKEEIIQVVGHTPVNEVEKYKNIIYCDNLERGDGIPLVLKIE